MNDDSKATDEQLHRRAMELLNQPAPVIEYEKPQKILEDSYYNLLAAERHVAQMLIRHLDDAEEIARQHLDFLKARQRRIDQAGRIRGFLLRVRFKVADWAVRCKNGLESARKRQQALKQDHNG